MNIRKFSQLSESNLSIGELSRVGKDGLRGDTLLKKIRDIGDSQLVVNTKDENDKEITIKNTDDILSKLGDDNYDEEKARELFIKPNSNRYNPVFQGDDDKFYKLSDLKKTTEFGSSNGSSLGTSDTRDIESIQCLVLSIRQLKGYNLTLDEVMLLGEMNPARLERFTKSISTDVVITNDLIKKYIGNWGDTFQKTANALYSKTKISVDEKSDTILKSDIKYKFYQIASNEGVCLAVKSAFKRAKQSVNMSKWNPSDTWAVSRQAEQRIIKMLDSCNDIKTLNNIIDTFFDNRNLVGISLKKVDKNEEITMIINKVTTPPIYKFTAIKLSESALSTTGIQIKADKKSGLGEGVEYMSVRSFGGTIVRNISGEMHGKVARQGSISLNRINRILGKYNEYVPTVQSISESDEELVEIIEKLNDELISLGSDKCVLSSVRPSTTENNRARLVSKYQSLYLAKVLLNNVNTIGNITDSIIAEMFYYALSIMYDNGRTPKFVRVIDSK